MEWLQRRFKHQKVNRMRMLDVMVTFKVFKSHEILRG